MFWIVDCDSYLERIDFVSGPYLTIEQALSLMEDMGFDNEPCIAKVMPCAVKYSLAEEE